ncbi:MAG: right-handed parallel beta-helix repeat-containing protein, partial [Phycicoccus sp.]
MTALVRAVNGGAPGDTVVVAPGNYRLPVALRPKAGMTIRGSGAGRTVLRNASSWAPGTAGLGADEGATLGGVDCGSYLIDLGRDNIDLTVSDLTLTGPQLHGGICGVALRGVSIERVRFVDFLWSGVRTFVMERATIRDNTFHNAGGRSGVTDGAVGGGLFLTYTKAAEISNNTFTQRSRFEGDHYYGIKGREARDVDIHHNTVVAGGFSIEFPFENDWNVDIHHNYLRNPLSFPKWGGGDHPEGTRTFHVHHNYLQSGWAFEFQRNGMEIDHNLVDADPDNESNLISGFDPVPADGGTTMHDNLIKNPGRGLYW